MVCSHGVLDCAGSVKHHSGRHRRRPVCFPAKAALCVPTAQALQRCLRRQFRRHPRCPRLLPARRGSFRKRVSSTARLVLDQPGRLLACFQTQLRESVCPAGGVAAPEGRFLAFLGFSQISENTKQMLAVSFLRARRPKAGKAVRYSELPRQTKYCR